MTHKIKHTPAPWFFLDGKIKCKKYNLFDVNSSRTSEGIANANLVASAPELLNALEILAQELEDVYDVPQYVYDAIAKANGK